MWRVWSVVCTVCIRYGVPCRRGLAVGYGVHVWRWCRRAMALYMRIGMVCYGVYVACVGTVLWRVCGVCGYGVQALGVRMVSVCVCVGCVCRVVYVVYIVL